LFKALQAWNQISGESVVPLGVACPEALARACSCSRPYPDHWIEGEPYKFEEGLSPTIEGIGQPERRVSWLGEFEKCIKCYGCRNICPMCFCDECALDSEDVVSRGTIPPEFPMFHLVRAVHMVGRCVDCGLCEEACPAGIPLRALYKKVNEIVFTHFHFRPGFDIKKRSPLHEVAEPPPTR
jgi:ferredoxin